MRIIAAFRFKEVNVEVASNVNRFVRGVKPFNRIIKIREKTLRRVEGITKK